MKSTSSTLERRVVLKRAGGGLALLALAPVASTLAGCGKKELSCAQAPGLSAADAQTRTTLHYADRSPDPAKNCDNCRLFHSAGADACGSCDVVKGPINPHGHCTAWVAKS